MTDHKRLIEVIRNNQNFEISHQDIEIALGKVLEKQEVLRIYKSIGINLKNYNNSYRFRHIDFLQKRVIEERLSELSNLYQIRLEIEDIIETTSKYFINEEVVEGSFSLCFAEFQTAGKGRGKNKWLSPFGSGICFSITGTLPKKLSPLGLSIYCGIIIASEFKKIGFEGVSLKWPNDLIYRGMKLGGILIELNTQTNGIYAFNIGIGVNYDLHKELNEIEENIFPPTDLMQVNSRSKYSRSDLSGILAKKIIMALSAFEQTTMNHVFQSWKEYDSFNEQKITMIEGDKCITGINMGINHEGALLIDEEGTTKTVYNGHLVI